MADKMSVGFIGLGNLGNHLARNVLKAGFPLTVWNRSAEKASSLLEAGANWAENPQEVADKSDIVCTCLSDAAAVREVLLGENGVTSSQKRPLVVEMSTISPGDSLEVSGALAKQGFQMLDAPVSGSTKAAQDAAVTILVGGASRDLEKARPVLQATAKTIFHMGPPGTGCYMKLVNNVILAVVLAGFAEAFVMGRKAGLEPGKVLEVVLRGSASCPLLEFKGKAIAERKFSPTFHLKMMRKDLTLALATADSLEASMPLTSLVNELHQAGMAQGLGEEDFSSIVKVFEGLSSLE